MAQNVDITFDSAQLLFTFDPDPVTVTAAGKIILHRKPHGAAWQFTGGGVKNDYRGQFSSSVTGGGSLLEIDDGLTDPKGRIYLYPYFVTVTENGTDYYSEDPVIVNDPGSRGGHHSSVRAVQGKP